MTRSLFCPAIDSEAPAELHARAAALTQRIDALNADRESLESDRHAFRSADPESIGDDDLERADGFRRREFALLKSEIALRTDLVKLADDHAAALIELTDAACRAMQQAECDVRKRLIKAGYLDAPPTEDVFGRFTPEMIHRHPAVRAARNRYEELLARRGDRSFAQANTEALRTLREKMTLALSRLAAV